jgi:iron complex outermembrane receptor protein
MKTLFPFKLTLLSLAIISSFSVLAAETKQKEMTEFAPMVVTATRSAVSELKAPVNATVIDSDTMERRQTLRIGDALKDVPGMYLRGSAFGTNFPGSGQSTMAFHGISGSRRSLFLIDGQPINSGSFGTINWNSFLMEDAERIEVIPGAFSALYGSGAMGGVINLITKVPTERAIHFTTGGGGGSVNQWWTRGSYQDRFKNGLGVSVSFNHMDSFGYDDSDYVIATPGANSTANPLTGAIPTTTSQGTPAYLVGLKGARNWTQDNAQIKLFYDIDDNTDIMAGFAWDNNDNGYNPYTSFLRNSSGSIVDNASGSINGKSVSIRPVSFLTSTPSYEETYRYFSRLNHDFGDEITLNADISYLDLNFISSTASNAATANPAVTYNGGAGTLSAIPNDRLDANVSVRMPVKFLARNYLTVGFSGNHNTIDSYRGQLNNFRDEKSLKGYDSTSVGSSTLLSGFIQDEWGILENLTAYAGGRFDHWETEGTITSGTFTKNYANRSVSQFNPKFALVWNPVEKSKLFASAGWAFRPPTLSDLYSTTVLTSQIGGARVTSEAAPDLKPETMFSWEVGGEKFFDTTGTNIAATYFHHYLSDLMYTRSFTTLTQNDTRSLSNAGSAEVDGVELKVSQNLYWDWVRLVGTYSLNNSEMTENTANRASEGKWMTQLPRTMYSMGLEVDKNDWSGSVIGRYMGHVYSNDANLDYVNGVFGSYDTFVKVDMRLNYKVTKNVKLGVFVDNLMDRDYFQFYKQPGRSVYGEVSFNY